MLKIVFSEIVGRDVFEPVDWPKNFFIERSDLDTTAAQFVEKGRRGVWKPVEDHGLPRLSFFPPGEPGRVVGVCNWT